MIERGPEKPGPLSSELPVVVSVPSDTLTADALVPERFPGP